MIAIRDWMSQPIISISKDKSIFETAKRMDEKQIGVLPVMKGDVLEGIVTERDVVRKVVAKGLDPHQVVVAEIMSQHVLTVDVDAKLIDVAKMMIDKKFRRVLVTENAKIIGIITARDLVKMLSGATSKK